MRREFGTYIRSGIEEKNMTQKQVANKLNISPQTLNSYIKNRRVPNIDCLCDLIEILNLDLYRLLDIPTKIKKTSIEHKLLQRFKKLTNEQKKCLFTMLDYFESEKTK